MSGSGGESPRGAAPDERLGRLDPGAPVAPGAAAPSAGGSSVFATLLPHARGDQINEFRWALAGGVLALALLVIAGLITAAILLSALLVPVLYVMYLYEARVYRDAPIPVVGVTLGGGLILGIVVSALATRLVPGVPIVASTPFGDSVDVAGLLLVGLALPLVKEVIKPWPAFLLRTRPDLSEPIDGLVLGIATGLGFSIAETLIRFSQILTAQGLDTSAAGWIYPLVSTAIFTPLIGGSTTGLITAALWRYRRGSALNAVQLGALMVALGASVAHVMGTTILIEFGASRIVALGWELVIVAIVLLYVRLVLRRGLVEEARELGLPDPTHPAQRADR